jgi:hypothetical protein
LDERSLVLNVLRPLLVDNEQDVRQHVVEWVENIRQAPNLDRPTEERLISVLSQMIEEKFKTLNYKELSDMLRLTPLRETASVQEVIKEGRVELLASQIQVKFNLAAEMLEPITADLKKLDLATLEVLFKQILRLETFEQLEYWIVDHLPKQKNGDNA